ncbi:MAG: hypothetical protein AAGD38_06060 [Acidobacteriota bacterium]
MIREDPRRQFLHTSLRGLMLDHYMDKVEELLLDHPARARHWAEILPEELSHVDDTDRQVRGYTILGATRSATADFELAEEAFTLAFTLTPSDTSFPYSAWRHAVRARYWIHRNDQTRAEEDVETGLDLLGDSRSQPYACVRALLFLSQGRFAFDRQDWERAAFKASQAIREAKSRKRKGVYPFGDRVRTAAAISYVSAMFEIDPARALWEMDNMNLVPQRMKRRGYVEPTRSSLVLSWAAGFFQVKIGHEKPGLANLVWATENLAEIGAVLDAARCAVDLVNVASKDHPAACAAMRALRDHPDTSEPLKKAAITWLASPEAIDPVPELKAALAAERSRRRQYR